MFGNLSITSSWDFMHGIIWCNCLHTLDRGSSSITKICRLLQKKKKRLKVFTNSCFSGIVSNGSQRLFLLFLCKTARLIPFIKAFFFCRCSSACSFINAKKSLFSKIAVLQRHSFAFSCTNLYPFETITYLRVIQPLLKSELSTKEHTLFCNIS